MIDSSRKIILERLERAPRTPSPARVTMPELTSASLDLEGRIEKFTGELTAQTGVVHRVPDNVSALEKLSEITKEENIKKLLAATDSTISPLDLPSWAAKAGIDLRTAADCGKKFKDTAFTWADAGLTGAHFGVAETGTLGIIHDKNSPRLISIAPILHIAVLRTEHLLGVYEEVTGTVFGGIAPSQFSFITGPSMTADIQATQFKGMHGPAKLIVILVG